MIELPLSSSSHIDLNESGDDDDDDKMQILEVQYVKTKKVFCTRNHR